VKRINKYPDSQIIQQHLRYPTHKKKIRQILEEEQEFYCAYTEERIKSPTIADDVEHFNALLKGEEGDGYYNWFAASHSWNHIKKDEQWAIFQPIMDPTDPHLENRLAYYDGFYLCHPDDTDAENLRDFLDLNNHSLVEERINYINALRDLNYSNAELQIYLAKHKGFIKFRRAIEAEFRFLV